MTNCDFIFMQPVSKSELVCQVCGHIYDPVIKICTCDEEYRKIVTWKQYVKHKIETGEYKK
jgi:hypothetical protein